MTDSRLAMRQPNCTQKKHDRRLMRANYLSFGCVSLSFVTFSEIGGLFPKKAVSFL